MQTTTQNLLPFIGRGLDAIEAVMDDLTSKGMEIEEIAVEAWKKAPGLAPEIILAATLAVLEDMDDRNQTVAVLHGWLFALAIQFSNQKGVLQ